MSNKMLCRVVFSAQDDSCITRTSTTAAAAAGVQCEWPAAVYARHWYAITCGLSWPAWHGQWRPCTHSHCMSASLIFTCIHSCFAPVVCLCVCLRAYLWNRWTDLLENFVCRSAVAVARFSSSSVAMHYVLPFLWMTSRLAVCTLQRWPWATWQYRGGVWCLWMIVMVARYSASE